MDFEDLKVNLGEHFARFADFIDDTVKWLNLPPESQILDIGTGYATMAIILAYNEFNVITGEPEGDNWFDWQFSLKPHKLMNKFIFNRLMQRIYPLMMKNLMGSF